MNDYARGLEAISELLRRGVLYSAVTVPTVRQTSEMQTYRVIPGPPDTVRMRCESEECRREGPFDRQGGDYPWVVGNTREVTYACRTCRETIVTVFLLGSQGGNANEAEVHLVGRVPRPAAYVEDELARALRTREHDLYLYTQALTERADGQGIGAMTYMRRVIENEMNALLDLLITNLGAFPDRIEQLRAAQALQGEFSFSDKARVADTVLPAEFFPGKQNPFSLLHSLCSDGVHNLDDVESSDRFDEANAVFQLLFLRLLQLREGKRLYDEGVTKLENVRSRRP